MRAQIGGIGSSLSIADILAALYGHILRHRDPGDSDRERLILSKGHAALALYAAICLRGWISDADLDTFCNDATLLGVHPTRDLPGVDFTTGSLGHGLPMGVGAALGVRLQGGSRRTFVIMSDAECNEGSVWEAAMFAAHHWLSTLVAIVDLNGQQSFGYTDEVLSLAPLTNRWAAFGWDAHEVDGHDISQLVRTTESLDTRKGPPHVVVAKTVFGRGVSFMEGQIAWHYRRMSRAEYRQAIKEIG